MARKFNEEDETDAIDDDNVSMDDNAGFHSASIETKEKERLEMQRQINAFLSKGGVIDVVGTDSNSH